MTQIRGGRTHVVPECGNRRQVFSDTTVTAKTARVSAGVTRRSSDSMLSSIEKCKWYRLNHIFRRVYASGRLFREAINTGLHLTHS